MIIYKAEYEKVIKKLEKDTLHDQISDLHIEREGLEKKLTRHKHETENLKNVI